MTFTQPYKYNHRTHANRFPLENGIQLVLAFRFMCEYALPQYCWGAGVLVLMAFHTRPILPYLRSSRTPDKYWVGSRRICLCVYVCSCKPISPSWGRQDEETNPGSIVFRVRRRRRRQISCRFMPIALCDGLQMCAKCLYVRVCTT